MRRILLPGPAQPALASLAVSLALPCLFLAPVWAPARVMSAVEPNGVFRIEALPAVFHDARTRAREPEGMQPRFYFVDDLQGRRVGILAGGRHAAGRSALAWDLRDDAGRPVAPGVCLARLSGEAGERSRRIVVLH